jgi:hypothetical protein
MNGGKVEGCLRFESKSKFSPSRQACTRSKIQNLSKDTQKLIKS